MFYDIKWKAFPEVYTNLFSSPDRLETFTNYPVLEGSECDSYSLQKNKQEIKLHV